MLPAFDPWNPELGEQVQREADQSVAVEFMHPLRHDPKLHTLNTLLRLPAANDPVPVIAAQLAQGNLRAPWSAPQRAAKHRRRWCEKPRPPRWGLCAAKTIPAPRPSKC